ncbi:hypothetical protein ABH922_000252 [Rhodococcus sp. 27YEA15]|uniref:hypothetical protein n=1 Tax=Rhodococcus sp. 27YEA15 TaxID=3156259 RepID=UPI003C7E28D1
MTENSHLEPALISPVVGGMVRTWTEGESALWTVDDPGALGALLGHGQVARTMMPDNRFREIVLLDSETKTLFVQPRFATPGDGTAELLAKPFELGDPTTPADLTAVGTDRWEELESLLASVAISAAGRREFWLAELGGWEAPHQPNFLFTVVEEHGVATAVMEATPAPVGSDVWPDAPRGRSNVSVSAPASQDTVEAAGIFAVSAIETWKTTPWDVVLTFGRLSEFT